MLQLLAARSSLSRRVAGDVPLGGEATEARTRTRLHMAAQAVTRASSAPTWLAALDNLDAALYEIVEALCPEMVNEPSLPREAEGLVAWSARLDSWVVEFDGRATWVWVEGEWRRVP